MFVNNNLDVNGNTASFGVNGLNPGYSLIYTNGTPATVDFSASAPGVNWIWSQATNQPQLKLGSTNTLSLFAPGSASAAITLNPAGTSTFSQGLTVTGTLTATGGLVSPNGIVTGGATGLSLQAGGTGNQNITLVPTGTGVTTTASPVTITNATASSSTTTGALVVTGGVGVNGTLTAGNITTGGTVNAGTLRVTNIAPSLTNLGLGTTNIANFGAINAADPSFFYPAPVAKVSHTDTTGPFLSAPQVVTLAGNFAYVGSSASTSFQILDITNPLLPVKRGALIGTGGAAANLSFPRGIAISGSYAYVTSSTNNSLQVINIANPDAPVAAGSLLNGVGGAVLSAPYGIAIAGNYAYIASSSSKALEIVNISNPAAPVHAGQLTNATWLNGARAVAVAGNYAYVVSTTGGSLAVVNVSNPAAPTLAATLGNNAAGPLLLGPTAIAISGNYAYVTSASSNALQIIDISNPLKPVGKGSLVNGTGGAQLSTPSALTVVGTTAFVTVTGTTKALQIVDVSNPLSPTPKGQLLDGSGGALLNGPTSIAVSGNYAFVTAASSSALQVLSIASGGGFQIKNSTVLTTDAANNLLLGSGLPSGKVAIGTTNPTSRLTVAGTDTTAAASVVNFTDSTNKSLLFVRNDGKVGIGTSAPAAQLNIATSTGAGATTEFIRLSPAGGANTSATTARIAGYSDVINGYVDFTRVTESGPITSVTLGTAGGPGLTLLSGGTSDTGNVGIGTITPTEKLDVVGNAKISGTLTVNGQPVATADQLTGYATTAQLANLPVPSFANLQAKPNTVAGYGIIDAVVKDDSGRATVDSINVTTGSIYVGNEKLGRLTGVDVLTGVQHYQVFFGIDAGVDSTNADIANFIGANAGYGANGATYSNFLGFGAGQGATNAAGSNFIGTNAGNGITNASLVNAFGWFAGSGSSNATASNFIGQAAGANAPNANNALFIGKYAGLNDTVNNSGSGYKSSILIGSYTNTGGFSDSIAIGQGTQNSAAQQVNIGRVFYITGIASNPDIDPSGYPLPSAVPLPTGKVGIGTDAPSSTLDVVGDAKISGTLTVGQTVGIFNEQDFWAQPSTLEVLGDAKITGTLTVGGQTVVTANKLADYATTADVTTQLGPYQLATGSGSGLTKLNATQLTTGTLPAARIANASLPLAVLAVDPLARANHTGTQAWTTLTATPTTVAGYGITDALTATGSGANLTALNATQITTGTLPAARIAAGSLPWTTLTGRPTTVAGYGITDAMSTTGSGAGLTALNATQLTTGTLPIARIAAASVTNDKLTTNPLARANHTGTQAWSTLTTTPTTVAGYGITDAVQKTPTGEVTVTGATALQGTATVTGATTLNGSVTVNAPMTVNRRVAKLRVDPQGDLSMGGFEAGKDTP